MRFHNVVSRFRRTLWAALICIALSSGSSLFAREAFSMYMVSGTPTSYTVPAGYRLVIEGVHIGSNTQLLFALSACNKGAPTNPPGTAVYQQCAAYDFVTPPVTNASLGTSLAAQTRIYVETSLTCYFSEGAPGTTVVPPGVLVTLTGYLESLTDGVF